MSEDDNENTAREQKTDNTVLIVLLTLGLLASGIFGLKWLMSTKPEANKMEPEAWTPSVQVISLTERDYTPVIRAEGEVESATKTLLISEVSGAVTYISPLLEIGNTIAKGEIIIKVDDADYKTQLISLRAVLADSELLLAQENARAEQAARDWKKLGRGGSASNLVLRKPQIKSALAKIEAAKANIEKVERDLSKTAIRAPYTCLVDKKFIDEGAYLTQWSQIAKVISVNEHEVRLPLNLNEVGFLDKNSGIGSEVLLESLIGRKMHRWKGTAVRFEGGVDSTTFSMVMVVSVKRDAVNDDTLFQLPPCGMFVKAKVLGKPMGKVFNIPRVALREGNVVWVLNDDKLLEIINVEVIRSERDEVIVAQIQNGKLSVGDNVIISPIAIPARGMKLALEKEKR